MKPIYCTLYVLTRCGARSYYEVTTSEMETIAGQFGLKTNIHFTQLFLKASRIVIIPYEAIDKLEVVTEAAKPSQRTHRWRMKAL